MINADDMQSWAYLLAPTFQFVNTAGKPLTEGWIEVYIAGTRNKYYCASDFNGTLHPFQIPLDSLGANIVLADPDQAYDVYVYNKYGSLVMSRYHVSPGMAGGSGVLNITIGSEDGTVSVTNDGNGNFDLSIQDTVDRIDALEQAVSGLSADSSVGYAIAHADTVELDGTFDLVNDAITGIGYTPNMDGFRLKSGHVYQFNFNALFENGEFDRNCSGKLYLEGPNTIAQEWKFDLDDSYYHSQSINGSTVLVTPNDLNYYDVKLKLAWDVDYPNKPNVDLNKISIVDITTILSTTVSGAGGSYTGGDGIFVNDETNVISVDMDYINSHLNIDASTIIASAVNIATAYTDARVTSVSGDLVNLIAEVSASIPTGTVTQVQSDWNEQDSSSPAYINNKPDLTIYATNASVSAVSSVLNERINDVSGAIPELPDEEEVEFEEIDLSDYALASSIPTDYVTHNEVSAVSANLVNYVNSVSGDITNYVDESIVSAINVATGSFEQVQSDWTEDDSTDPSYIQNKPNEIEIVAGQNIGIFSDATTITISASATDLSDYATNSEVSAVSAAIVNQIPDISDLATRTEVNNVSGVLETEIQIVSAAIGEQVPNVSIQSTSGTLVVTETVSGNNKIYSIDVAPTTGIEYGQFYATNITGAATMSRTKGNIDITNDGKIKLKQGQSYHITVRGRYNQTVLKDNYGYASYIEYVTNNSININVDESRSDSQYFELSYDLFKLNSDTDYYVFFTLDDATVNDLFIDIHSLANVGSNGSSGGSSPEYDAGYGIQILNNVISVSGIAPQVQSDWNQTNTSSVDYIKNKPEEYGLLAGNNISITASGNNFVISSTASAASGVNYQAGYGIDITGDTISVDASIIPSTSAYATKQELATVSGMIPDISGLATEAELQIVSASIPDVSNFVTGPTVSAIVDEALVDVPSGVSGVVAGNGISITASGSNYVISCNVTGGGDVTRADLDAVSGKLPTTEYGKFIIQNNVSGGPIEVVCPTDVGMPVMNTILDSNAVSGIVGSGTSNVYIVYKSPGYDNDYWNYSNNQIVLTVPEDVTGIYSLYAYYSNNSNPLSNAPYLINNYVVPDTQYYKLAAGTYTISTQANQASSGYGKYITFILAGPNPDATAFAKATIKGIERHPELGISVDLDRYYLGNTRTTTSNSGIQPLIYTDPTTKKQSVFLPSSMPSDWLNSIVQYVEYGNNNFNPSYTINKQYIAYKSTTNPTRYQYALCTDYDRTNKKMTFISYNESGVAIEKWTVNYSTYGSYVWTTTPISNGSTYTAGTGIDITNEVISVDDTVITTGASGVSLPNSKFEIDTNGQAYKVITEASEIDYNSYYDGGLYYGWYYNLPDITETPRVMKAGTYRITVYNDNMKSLKLSGYGNFSSYNNLVIPINDNHADLIITQDVPVISSYDTIGIYAWSNSDGTGSIIGISSSSDATVKYVVPAVTDEYITETALTEAISAVTGAVVYQAGDYIGITDDTISVTGITDLVAGDNITITASGSSAIISSNGSGDVTIEELASVSGTLETEIQVVSAAIPTLPTEEEVEFEELDLSDYALASAIPDISSLSSKSEVNSVSGTLQTEIVAISGAMVDVPTGVSGVVAGQGISITASGSDYVISCTVTGGTSDVTMADLVSVSGTLQAEIQTVSGAIPSISNLATKTEVANVEADVQIVSAAIPTLPTEEEVEFTEVDLSDYALASAIPDVSNLATKSELQTVSAAIPDVSNFVTGPTVSAIVDTALIDVPTGVSGLVGGTNVSITASGSNYVIDATVPDVSNLATKTEVATVSAAIPDTSTLATKTEVTTGLGTKQNTLTGITDVQVVQALPASPVSTVLYLIPEA